MSEIVDATGRQIRPPKRRGSDLATLNEVLNVVGNATGPLAVVLNEVMAKVARLEDKLGITDETVALETEPPKGAPYKCMTPRPAPEQEAAKQEAEHTPGGDVE